MPDSPSSPRPWDLLVRGGLIVDPEQGRATPGDIAVTDGRIAALGPELDPRGAEIYHAEGLLVTPGLIDLHTHVYEEATSLGLAADRAGLDNAVTTVVDAGSCGSDHWEDFSRAVVVPAATRVLAWLNISRHGLVHGTRELAGGPGDIDLDATAGLLARHSDTLRGVKVRMSRSVLGDSGLAPLRAATSLGVPVMVHVGNAPPDFGDVLDLLREGDVVTHAFHGKRGGLFGGTSEVIPQARAALERGVRLDVGHGSASFSFATAEAALRAGVRPHTVSTDLHRRNVDGPVHGLPATLSKLLALGLPLTEVVRAATLHPAQVLGLADGLGTLRVGAVADLSLLRPDRAPHLLTDAEGEQRQAETALLPVAAVRAGRVYPAAREEQAGTPPGGPSAAAPSTSA
ncbi:amidohydrolase/deacetylase family metallohydrolase [Streptomyces sp. NPDC059740]|uniref:amidohydrolase/deacetylase family metallohydrolase n=1 Tax=Streptomyces sp. NPDC059740 TaxID=3346926 RepID=UPI0036623671